MVPAFEGIVNTVAFVEFAVHIPCTHSKEGLGRVLEGHTAVEEETGEAIGEVVVGALAGDTGVGVPILALNKTVDVILEVCISLIRRGGPPVGNWRRSAKAGFGS